MDKTSTTDHLTRNERNDVNLLPIVSMLKRAPRKYPSIRFKRAGQVLRLSLAGDRARYPGSVNLTDEGRYPDNVWYGRVQADGKLEQSRSYEPWVGELLSAFAADPVCFLQKYGAESNECCFCATRLETPESVSAGYGPTCAKTFGLPWGKSKTAAVPATLKDDERVEHCEEKRAEQKREREQERLAYLSDPDVSPAEQITRSLHNLAALGGIRLGGAS